MVGETNNLQQIVSKSVDRFRRYGHVYISQCRLWRPPFCKPCHVTKIEKYLFTGLGLCFALENSSSSLHCIKRMHIGHSLTLYCIRTAVILIFVIVRLCRHSLTTSFWTHNLVLDSHNQNF